MHLVEPRRPLHQSAPRFPILTSLPRPRLRASTGRLHFSPKTHLHQIVYNRPSDLGYGGVLGHDWFMEEFTEQQRSLTIAWRELYAILIACTIWGPNFASKRLTILCDNLAIVYCVNAGSSKCPNIMVLIRALFLLACKYNFELRLTHVPGIENIGPDRLSRLDLIAFRRHDPVSNSVGRRVPYIDLRDDF